MNAASNTPNKIRVLIVEDEVVVARDIGQLLVHQGYVLAGETARGEAAVTLVDELRPDLILMDVSLAGAMDGITAARLIREQFALPVIFLTSYFDQKTLERAKEAEPFGYIIKPFDEQDLRAVIEMALFKHRVEVRLRHTQTRHDKMLVSMGDVIAIVDHVGIVRYKSPNLLRLFGWCPEEVVGSSAFDRVHPEDLETSRIFFTALLEEPNANGTTEYRYRCKDGSYRWVEFMGVNLTQDPDIGGVLGDYHDITERKKAEKHLQLQSGALEAAANAMVITDRDGLVEWANPAFTAISGYSLAEAVGQTPGQLLKSGKHDLAFYRNLWRTITAGKIWQGEIVNRRKDGSLFTEDMTVTPMVGDTGEITHFIAVKQDITLRKSLEAQLLQSQKMEAIGLLAGGVAHDFNNILAAVLMYLGLLQDEKKLGPDTRGSLKQLEKEVRRGATLTRQLLTFSRQQAMEPARLNLNTVVEGLTKMLHRLLGEQITITHAQPERVMLMEADEGMIEQVIMNLCINARDAMPRGGELKLAIDSIEIPAEVPLTRAEARPGRFLCLAISDTGSGMDAPTLQRIFEPFFTTKETGKGTGLGLAIVHGIVKQHHGWIEVESATGQGSTFRVYLPECAPGGLEQAAPDALPEIARGQGETIMVTEDDASLRTAMVQVLRRNGYKVIEANNGPQAIERWQECGGRVDLVLTDMIMPGGMDGQDLIGHLLGKKWDLKIIVCTGYGQLDSAEPFAGNPRITLLRKPFDLSVLLASVRRILEQTQSA